MVTRRLFQLPEAVRAPFCASGSDAASSPSGEDQRRRQVRAAETRLLYENATLGIVVTVVSITGRRRWAQVSTAAS